MLNHVTNLAHVMFLTKESIYKEVNGEGEKNRTLF